MGEMKQVMNPDKKLWDRIENGEFPDADVYEDGTLWVPVSFDEEGYTYG